MSESVTIACLYFLRGVIFRYKIKNRIDRAMKVRSRSGGLLRFMEGVGVCVVSKAEMSDVAGSCLGGLEEGFMEEGMGRQQF